MTRKSKSACGTSVTNPIIAKICSRATRAVEVPALDDEINFEFIKKSALANQEILPKRGLKNLMNFAETLGAVAVNVAHSGTVTGIFFRADDLQVKEKISAVRKRFDFLKFLMLTKLAI